MRARTAPPSRSGCSTCRTLPRVAAESARLPIADARADRVRARLVPLPDARARRAPRRRARASSRARRLRSSGRAAAGSPRCCRSSCASPSRRPGGFASARTTSRASIRRPGAASRRTCRSSRRSSGGRSPTTSGSERPMPPIEEVRAAAALARADDFVRALPDGYETVVGEGGRALSAGERRRVALARAFLRDAPLVLLDEPTADLDPESASIVADAVDVLREGRTVVLVAHRPELAERADRIVRIGGVAGGRRVTTTRRLLAARRHAARPHGARRRARRARRRVRDRADDRRRLPHLARGRAAADPRADDDDRRRPLPRARAAAGALPRAAGVPRPRAARTRPDPLDRLPSRSSRSRRASSTRTAAATS